MVRQEEDENSRIGRIVLAFVYTLASAIAFGGAAGSLGLLALGEPGAAFGIVVVLATLVTGAIRRGRGFRVVFEIAMLGVLIAWGMGLNHSLTATCVRSPCGDDMQRYLAEPEIYGLALLHVANVVAYAVSRRRPEALPPVAEALVTGTLVSGIVMQIVVAAQFAGALVIGLVLLPVAMPAAAPAIVITLYVIELVVRLRRRGTEAALARADGQGGALPFVLRGLAASPLVLGVHAMINGLIFRDPAGAIRVFTRTCDHTLSTLPLVIPKGDCHYLCTVAARGHAALVGPERLGTRRGHVIVVNRQLAIANAFEDLLHARWPRFGRLARRVYDRLGFPVSQLIRSRWVADAVYLAMKPAEWLFYLTLLLLDPGAPEERIDRMYR